MCLMINLKIQNKNKVICWHHLATLFEDLKLLKKKIYNFSLLNWMIKI